jgi:hypothetical protein
MAGRGRALAAGPRRNFNYTIRQPFCQVKIHQHFVQRSSQNLYFTNKKVFDIIIIVKGRGR